MNELLFFLTIPLYFGLMLLAFKFFGKTGLFIWSCFAIITANIEALKLVTFFGLNVTLGNVLYASTYLVTDIIGERYGKAEAQKTVNMGFFFLVCYIIITQTMLLFAPGAEDFANQSMNTLFGIAPRLCLGSIVTYLVMQRLDIWLFHKISTKTKGKHLWLRNTAATMVAQLFDSIVFNVIAFYGVFSFDVLVSVIFTTYLLKFILSIFDTPFIYLAMKIKPYDPQGLIK